MIAVISHLPLQSDGGGTYAVTWNLWRVLNERLPDLRFFRLTPTCDLPARFRSLVLRRILHRPGNFFQFSQKTLLHTAGQLQRLLPRNAGHVLFRTSTRWIACRPRVPYFVHLDAVFHTFHRNTFRAGAFDRSDLQRIYDQEAEFLEGAAGVFFESQWGLQQALSNYRLRGTHYHSVGVAGNLPTPSQFPSGKRDHSILTIAKNFAQKGGDYVAEAWPVLRTQFPDCCWHIVGGPPPTSVRSIPGVSYHGYLKASAPVDLQKLQRLLSSSSLLIHPTREDINPLVLLEAAGYGCPAVTVRDFAIPELVLDGETGVLLDRPLSGAKIAASICSLWEDQHRLDRFSRAAWERVRVSSGWERIGCSIADAIGRTTTDSPTVETQPSSTLG